MQNQKNPNTTNSVGTGKDGSGKREGSSGRLKETSTQRKRRLEKELMKRHETLASEDPVAKRTRLDKHHLRVSQSRESETCEQCEI